MGAKLVHTANGPLARSLKLAARTLAARDLDGDAGFRLPFVKDQPARTRAGLWSVGRQRAITGHYKRIPPRIGLDRMFLTWVVDACREKWRSDLPRLILERCIGMPLGLGVAGGFLSLSTVTSRGELCGAQWPRPLRSSAPYGADLSEGGLTISTFWGAGSTGRGAARPHSRSLSAF